MRNGKSRKEFYFTAEEKAIIQITARRFHIDESSMVRVLIQLGYECLNYTPYTTSSAVTPSSTTAIPPG